MNRFHVRPLHDGDRDWVKLLLEERWLSTDIVTRGRVHHADRLPGFTATLDDTPVGLVTYHIEDDACEIITLNSLVERWGIGSALIEAVREAAVAAGCSRLWLISTNDNQAALCFYQRKGFSVVAVYHDALEESRRLKPEI
ncbi:MAG TPA: GNAT family N-acetyltransferase, partial [Anaerolineae bacterium]|nr:GNAT family N-acetyltransferase [Anaerolineae bacterium]